MLKCSLPDQIIAYQSEIRSAATVTDCS